MNGWKGRVIILKRNDEFRLNVISEIDDEIIERATLKRDKLLRRPKVSIRKKNNSPRLFGGNACYDHRQHFYDSSR